MGKGKRQDVDYSKDENEERGNWAGRLDFILSAIGFAVGLGNVWRFPYLCYRNGGGAFLIPYTLMLTLAGLPLFFMELALGQFVSEGPSVSFALLCPLAKGIGYTMMSISALVGLYYNVILAYSIFFFFASFVNFKADVPWATCGNAWNTENCGRAGAMEGNATTNMTNSIATTMASMVNNTMDAMNTTAMRRVSPAEEYWDNFVLERTSGIDDLGGLNWKVTLSLLAAWLIVFLCLVKGIKSTGKVVYFTATFPYVVLTILIIRGATLPGSLEGVKYYIIPDFDKLSNPSVWGDAAVQIFYSLGPAWGGLLTMASYNRFNNNCYRDAVIVAITNCGTSVYAGFAIFSVIGFMSSELGVPIEDAATSGPGLAFVAYPEGLSRMPVSSLWATLFFFMLITLGLDSMFVMTETVICGITDDFPVLRQKKALFTLFVCCIGFFLGLPMTTKGGIYVMTLMDWYSAGFSLFTVALLEVTLIMYRYGYSNFAEDIRVMIGHKPNIYWVATWNVLSPAVLLGILIFSAVTHTPVSYGDVPYPEWAVALGWLMVVFALMFIPIIAIGVWIKSDYSGSFLDKLDHLTSPTKRWGPALQEHRDQRYGVLQQPSSEMYHKDKEGIDNEGMGAPGYAAV